MANSRIFGEVVVGSPYIRVPPDLFRFCMPELSEGESAPCFGNTLHACFLGALRLEKLYDHFFHNARVANLGWSVSAELEE